MSGRAARVGTVALLVVAAGVLAACDAAKAREQAAPGSVFTTARRTTAEAVNDFFGRRPDAVQPIEFPHKTHVEKGLTCTEYCHESATKGPVAGLPSVTTCMICHESIATDRPLIKTMTENHAKGLDLAWQRVYGYPRGSHVRFNHAPHIRAEVDCATCHGDVASQTVARRNVDLTMGFCVGCHKSKGAPNDCITCHF